MAAEKKPCHEPAPEAPKTCCHGHAAQAPVDYTDVPEGTVFICPMHLEIRQIGPGTCPICGMALEPETVTADTGPSEEYLDMLRRFKVATVLAVPLVILAMGRHLVPGLFHGLPGWSLSWAELLLATPIVLWAGWPFFVRGWQSIKTTNYNMFTLIAIGTGIAWAYSVVATVAPGIFPMRSETPRRCRALFRGGGGHRHPRPFGPGARAEGQGADLGRHPRPARPRPRHRAAARRRGRGARGGAGRDQGRRSAARPPRRQGAPGRHGGRGWQRARRIDAHRRSHAGREEPRAMPSPAAPSTAAAAS
jgi:hypothetical protein